MKKMLQENDCMIPFSLLAKLDHGANDFPAYLLERHQLEMARTSKRYDAVMANIASGVTSLHGLPMTIASSTSQACRGRGHRQET